MSDNPAQPIPDRDELSRLIFVRSLFQDDLDYIEIELFEFPSDLERPDYHRAESVVWRAFCVSDDEVNTLGCAKESEKRISGKNQVYLGARTATAGAIRAKRTQRGHGFTVVHYPKEGDWHVHIVVVEKPDVKYNKQDKSDVRALMQNLFCPRRDHRCARG